MSGARPCWWIALACPAMIAAGLGVMFSSGPNGPDLTSSKGLAILAFGVALLCVGIAGTAGVVANWLGADGDEPL